MMTPDFSLKLDLKGALALFLLVEGQARDANADIDALERALREYLYERLSIAEMEEPGRLYARMCSGREGNGKGS